MDEEVAVARRHGLQAASAGADDAGHAVGILERHLQARLLDRFIGGRSGKPGVAVGVQDDLIALKMPEARLGIEVPDLGADQDLEIPHVEAVEGGYAKLRASAAFPELSHRGADRRDDSKTRHDDTVRYRGPLHLELVLLLYAPAMHGDAGRADQAFAAAAPELSMRARTRSTTEPTVLKSAASSLAL